MVRHGRRRLHPSSTRRRRSRVPGAVRLRSLLLPAAMPVAVVLAVGVSPASAATVGQTPQPTWSVFRACVARPGPANCAAVSAIAHVGRTVFLGGQFDRAYDPRSGATVRYDDLVAVNADTGKPVAAFARHSFNGSVLALAVAGDGTRLYVGGAFTTVDGRAEAAHLIALNPSTGALKPFPAQVGGTVRALMAARGRLYVGGSFTTVQGHSRGRVAALDATSARLVAGFRPTVAAARGKADVRSFSLGPDRLYLAGHFDKVNGTARSTVAAVSPGTGALDPTFDPAIDESDADPLQAGDQVMAVESAGSRRPPGVLLAQAGHVNRAYRFDLSGNPVWTLALDGDVQALALSGSVVYLGGHFTCVTGCFPPSTAPVRRVHVAAVSYASAAGGVPAVDPRWLPALGPTTAPYYYGVWALEMVGGQLWTGGVFNSVTVAGRTYQQPKVAVFGH